MASQGLEAACIKASPISMTEDELIFLAAATIYSNIKGNPAFTIDLNGQTVFNIQYEHECRKRSIERARALLIDVHTKSNCCFSTVSFGPNGEQVCDKCKKSCQLAKPLNMVMVPKEE